MGVSAIREILKVVSQPGMVSLAGGMPAPEAFPIDLIAGLTMTVLDKYASRALQYGTTEGFMPLREELAKYVAGTGVAATPDEINITSGSQGLLDSLGKILIAQGDKIAVESPTYLGALQAFAPYGPDYLELETDSQGVVPEYLEKILTEQRVKFVYLVPTFQNPTGKTIPVGRREKIAAIIRKHDTLLVEDDPYSALRYRGTALPPIHKFAPEHVLYTSTFSKIFAPGLRIGYYVGPKFIAKWLVLAKQGVDLHTSTFTQALASEYLAGGHIQAHLPKIVNLYRPRQEAMLDAMEEYFPKAFNWTRPEGGMFIWVEGPPGMDLDPIYHQAVAEKVAFVPGKHFFARAGRGKETMRLNYTMKDEKTIQGAIRILGGILDRALG
ncbi:MAG TPA: PLP-dependent aminotransferase family protein [Myxococcota bacterium]|nr:PLP-dependent aminotransferase family protein [Myxococcota bacterium]